MEKQQSFTPADAAAHQPPPLATRTTQDSREARIRTALRLAGGPLPRAETQWLSRYFDHLAARLSLPFAAHYAGPAGRFQQEVTVVALLDPAGTTDRQHDGLICAVEVGAQRAELPLVDIEVDGQHPNFQLLDDYWYWLWNWRFDPRI